MPTPMNLHWADQGSDETSIAGGFTQNAGGINVSVTYTDDGLGNQFDVETSVSQYVGSGEPMDTNSAVEIRGDAGTADSSTTRISFDSVAGSGFSREVEDVMFRLNDVDNNNGGWLDVVQVRAYDANGNQIDVSMTYQGTTQTGTNPSVTGTGGNVTSASSVGSVLVQIAGPVAYFEIDYNNGGPAAQALWVTDIHFDAIDLDGTVEGTSGDDVIDDTYILDPDGDKVDDGDEILPGYGTDGDLIYAYGGNDTVLAGAGGDSIYAGTGADSVSGGDGDDTVFLEDGNDTFGDWATDAGNDTVYGGAGNDTINGGNDDDVLFGGADDDTLIGASGDDTLYGGTGNDTFFITDDHESDTIVGGEDVGDGDIDRIDFFNFASTDGVTITATGTETGTYDFDGTVGNGTFSEIEELHTTDYDDTVDMSLDGSGVSVSTQDGNDSIIGGGGDDIIDGGQGADTFNTGAGNDQINLGDDGAGSPDGDADVIILQDGFGDDTVTNFDAPTPNGDGTFTGIDTLDVSALYDLPVGDPSRTPVLTNDVVVSDDGFGNAVLTFPNGEAITLDGVSATDADNPFYLNALGIPMPDGTVAGTSGNDVIDGSYTGDPDGDLVDADDAILAGDTGDDDLIFGYGGDDDIYAGSGDDEIYGGDGDDTIDGGTGNDTLEGGIGNDRLIIASGTGSDLIQGGEDVGDGDVDTLAFTDGNGTDGVLVTMTGNEAGTYSFPIDGGSGTFTEVENIVLTDQDDDFDGVLATNGSTVDGGAGDDTLTGSTGSDSFEGGSGNDTLNGNAGDDTLSGGAGDDLIYGDEGDDSIDGGADNDEIYGGADDDSISGGTGDDSLYGGSGNDTLIGGDGNDTLSGGADQDVIYGGAGDVVDGSETGVDNDTLIVSGVDYIDYSDTNPENGIVYFEGGGSLIFSNIENVIVSDRDGTVSGTAGNDVINAGYTGDPDGDQVDDTDAIIAGHDPDDDLIEAGAGDDLIISGAGADTVYAGADNDTIMSGTGDDTLFGDAGNDLISSESGSDTVYGGTGDDIINGGTGADTLYGGNDDDTFVLETGFGADVIEGGEGGTDNDTLRSTQSVNMTVTATGDEAGTISDGTSTATFSEIETIETGDGNDTINLSADSTGMTVDAGAGDDIITGGSGDDDLSGGEGSDNFILGEGFGTDTITAGEDPSTFDFDVIDAGGMTSDVTLSFSGPEAGTLSDGTNTATFTETEAVVLGSGDDTVIGGTGNEVVYAGAGNDTMTGGEGQDTLYGGSGDDDITFSEGDYISGGSGNDTFTLENLGEPTNGTITIDGGLGSETGGDTLQLGSLGILTQEVRDTFVDDGTGSYSGTITLDDGTILSFSEIENIICFTPNTRIATPKGLVEIQDLEVGDMVVTRDHGLQPIRWIEGRTVPAVDRFAPVRIRKNVLEGQDRDLIVSPQHRVLFQGYRAELLFGESEVLVAATHLVDGIDVTQDEADMVTYVHMLFDQHEVVYAEGAATESFHPGDIGFSAVGDAAREELFAIFPELRVDPRAYGATARRCLKRHEAKLIRT